MTTSGPGRSTAAAGPPGGSRAQRPAPPGAAQPGRRACVAGLGHRRGNAGYFLGGLVGRPATAPGPTSSSTASSGGRWARTSWAAPSGCRGAPRRAPARVPGAARSSSRATPPCGPGSPSRGPRWPSPGTRGDVGVHGPVRTHPDRRQRRPRTGGLALRGGHLRGREHRLARVRCRRGGDDGRRHPHGEGAGARRPASTISTRTASPRWHRPASSTTSRRTIMAPTDGPRDPFEPPTNQSFPPEVIARIHQMAETGQYPIRGLGARRKLPTFDDLVFLTASVSRYPLEGYRERCETRTVLGARHGARPLELEIPITIAGMSFGALSATAKEALGRAATAVGHVDHDRRRRHDARGAQGLGAARLPGPPLPLRLRSGGPAPGRRGGDRRRPGGQAGWWRHAAGAEGERPGGRHADPATGHRPAFGQPPSRTGSAPTTCG